MTVKDIAKDMINSLPAKAAMTISDSHQLGTGKAGVSVLEIRNFAHSYWVKRVTVTSRGQAELSRG